MNGRMVIMMRSLATHSKTGSRMGNGTGRRVERMLVWLRKEGSK